MVLFIKKTILLFCISFFVFYLIGYFIEGIIANNLQNKQYQLQEDWHVKHKNKNDILFIGNSRTWVHVDAEYLTKSLKKKVYSLSQDGRDSRILFYKLRTYLSINLPPNEVYLQFDPYFLSNRNDGTFYGKINYLGYIYHDRLKINHVFQEEKGFELLDVYLPIRRYFSVTGGPQIFLHHLTNSTPSDYELYKYGSNPENRKWKEPLEWSTPPLTLWKLNFNFIDSLISLCQQNNIKLTLVYPPQSFSSYNKVDSGLLRQLEKYSDIKKIQYWNFNSEQYDDINLFYNHMHLNILGSSIYNRQLIDSINLLVPTLGER